MNKTILQHNRTKAKYVIVILLILVIVMVGGYAHYHGGIRHWLHSVREDIADYRQPIKTINCLGDSITEDYKNDEVSWADRLPHLTGAKVNKYGIGGSTLSAYVDEHPMCLRFADIDMDNDADCIIIFAGNNDFTRSVPLGDKDGYAPYPLCRTP